LIEAYADVWCPFAHVGLREALVRRRQVGLDDVPLRIRAWPLELVNGSPLDVATTAAHVAELRTQVAPDLFAGFDPEHFPTTTLPALALGAAAYREGGTVGEAVGMALRDALFESGLDVSDPGVLDEVARRYGVSPPVPADYENVLAEWHHGEVRGVKGSPHFFCGELDVFCPSLDINRDDDAHLQLRRNTVALSAFLEDCREEPTPDGGD
jgi:2-hydroxychromene-2-carboxylate isomerase